MANDLRPTASLYPRKIAIVGAGPTALYTLHHLTRDRGAPLRIEVYEQGRSPGPGMPYNEWMNDPAMLSNIASRELPPLTDTLADWLRAQGDRDLAAMGLDRDEITEDTFFPRLTLGAWFTAQMAEVVARARAQGHVVNTRLRHRVTDVAPGPQDVRIDWQSPAGTGSERFDEVVLATGHLWPDRTDTGGVALMSPWPAERIARLGQERIGVLGTSLSGIDVVVAIARARGRFIEDGTALRYEPHGGRDRFHLAMMSRKGLLPEADYWYELPLPDMPRLRAAVDARAPLDEAFAAFLGDMSDAAPEQLDLWGGPDVTRAGFNDRYFADRRAADPFAWAETNLAEAEVNRAAQRPVAWRSALLSAHEIFEELLPHLPEDAVREFLATLGPVFTDCYACVPHESIRRLLALYKAGHLSVIALGEDPQIKPVSGGILAGETEVEVLIDARGQTRASLDDLGFPSLSQALDRASPLRFDTFALPLKEGRAGRVHCLSLPVLLHRHPFVQGLVNSDDMGRRTAEAILEAPVPA